MRSNRMTAADGDGLDSLAPIGRETVQDRIYNYLRDALIRGAFEAGEVFLPGDIAKRMSVSSMPVREALARLVSERALETMPNRRVRVPMLSRDKARDIARSRTLIERDLAARATLVLRPDDLQRLESLTVDYEAAGDYRSVTDLNHAFHFALYEQAGSAVLLPFVESLWMQAGPYVRAAARLHRPLTDAAATLHHRGILEGLRSRDPERVAGELEADILQAFAILDRAGPEVWEAMEGAQA
ncbi:GntR family transcriptional regulator [Sulfitobacter sp. D35]|uniref:GntR family transcriptional regulator n=1 Tax=Sulfitobacter sp. D35 TaxID=3083252 RepID=UPI00296E4F7B|nr:GntR family transcriptional regulator [Sulfitobacter sp. D35]MDW4499993.1 GntR family transcriptional regulator [Sulfitobacter sp. D35]